MLYIFLPVINNFLAEQKKKTEFEFDVNVTNKSPVVLTIQKIFHIFYSINN